MALLIKSGHARQDKTTTPVESRYGQVKKTTTCLYTPLKHRGENGSLQCSAGPEKHGYRVIKDDMVCAWAPAVRHIVNNKKTEKEQAT